MLPTLFISHGSPSLTIENNQTTQFLKGLSKLYKKPKTIVVISAHWTTQELEILTNEEPELIYDFYNFPQKLYEQTYDIKNDTKTIEEIEQLLKNHHIKFFKNSTRSGYDHGVWSPLKLIYPNADIPVIQLSLPLSYSPKALVALGEVLSHLREETLIVASGAMTHNLHDMNWHNENAIPKSYAVAFRDWIVEKINANDYDALQSFESKAPKVKENHPTLEHFLPFFVALGAAKSNRAKVLNNTYMYGSLAMNSILFEDKKI